MYQRKAARISSILLKNKNTYSVEKLNENTNNTNEFSESKNYLCQKQWINLLQILNTIMFMIIQPVV